MASQQSSGVEAAAHWAPLDWAPLDPPAPLAARAAELDRAQPAAAFDWITLVFVQAGRATLFSELGRRTVRAGDVVLIGAHTLCGIEPDPVATLTTIALDRDFVIDQLYWQHAAFLHERSEADALLDAIYVRPARVLALDEAAATRIAPWLAELAAASEREPRPADYYRTQLLLFSVIDAVRPFVGAEIGEAALRPRPRAAGGTGGHLAALRHEARRAAAELRARPGERWSLASLARLVHLSPSQLGRVFADAYGRSPMSFLADIRTERMAELLRTSDDPVAELARRAGWSNADSAGRAFRRRLGATPSEYRAQGALTAPPSD